MRHAYHKTERGNKGPIIENFQMIKKAGTDKLPDGIIGQADVAFYGEVETNSFPAICW